MDDKVYTPEVITEIPFPSGGETSSTSQSSQSSSDTLTPTKTTDRVYPVKKSTVELLSTSLNTRSRKVLQEFQLEQSGGFQVGNFQEGLTGDIRITPNGITARDITGDTTFAIDGTTGDAVFKGEVRAADFVVSDENGLVSLANFRSGTVSAGGLQQTTSTSYSDLDSMVLVTPNFTRETVVLILFTAQIQIYSSSAAAGTWSIDFIVTVDGVENQTMYMTKESNNDASGGYDGLRFSTDTMHFLSTLSAGQHTIKIRYKVTNSDGAGTGSVYRRTLSFSSLGG